MKVGELRAKIAGEEWYHTLELAPGIVTPGWLDHRAIAKEMPFGSLEGKRCLDVATFDGFWAFEMERRGGEVVAIDVKDASEVDWPADSTSAVLEAMERRKRQGDGFELAKSAFGSSVERRWLSIYELDPDDIGQFDFIYLGSLLLHLRDPIGALMKVRGVCRGRLVICDAINPWWSMLSPHIPLATLEGTGRPWWWRPNVKGLERMAEGAGFKVLSTRRLRFQAGKGRPSPPITLPVLRSPQARRELLDVRVGDPHALLECA